jgi:NAD+-dependent secondary alcohol dehydrogenase Adh1
MKVVRVVGYHQNLQLDEAPEPKITSPLDVIVKIGAAGVCRTDIHILEGQWEEKAGVTLPYTIGHENAGWIHELGEGVTGLKKGDKVRRIFQLFSVADEVAGHSPPSCDLRPLPSMPFR